jgi:hypothetical protein
MNCYIYEESVIKSRVCGPVYMCACVCVCGGGGGERDTSGMIPQFQHFAFKQEYNARSPSRTTYTRISHEGSLQFLNVTEFM